MTVRDYSTTAADNDAAPPAGFPEGMAASAVNDSARQLMADVRETFEELPYFDWGDTPTRIDNDTFTLAGDLTARYPVGARVKLVGATTGTGRITVSSHAVGTTTIDVVMDSGNVPTSLVRVAVAPAPVASSTATPAAVTLSASAGTSSGLSRDDHVHALSQAIAPTWTGVHKFTANGALSTTAAITLSSTLPLQLFQETGAAANNKIWRQYALSEQYVFDIVNDAEDTTAKWLTVDRTGTTVDRVAFPTDSNAAPFSVGVAPSTTGSLLHSSTAINNTAAITAKSTTSAFATLFVWNTATSGDNILVSFLTEGSSGTTRGSITYNRGGGVVAYNTTCRERLKENIRGSAPALPLLMQIQVVSFDWRDSSASLPYFVTYERMEPVVPWACQNDGVDVSKLVPLTIKGVQEHESEIQSLRTQLTSLAARVAALEQAGGVTEIKPR